MVQKFLVPLYLLQQQYQNDKGAWVIATESVRFIACNHRENITCLGATGTRGSPLTNIATGVTILLIFISKTNKFRRVCARY